jgi:hypothetical protein
MVYYTNGNRGITKSTKSLDSDGYSDPTDILRSYLLREQTKYNIYVTLAQIKDFISRASNFGFFKGALHFFVWLEF